MSHWPIIPRMKLTHQTVFKILCKTTKYRSQTYTYFWRSIFVTQWSIIPSMTFLHQIVLKILSKITGPQNMGHWPHILYEVKRSIFVPRRSIMPKMTFLNQIVFKIISKITGLWNIGHWPTYIFEVNLCVTLIHYPKYDILASNSLQDI